MYDTNTVTLCGHLTRDPEMKNLQSGKSVCNFTIAVQCGEDAGFFNVTVWERLAENVNKFCSKGSQVIVSGRLQQRSFKDKEGNKRNVIEVSATGVQFIGKKSEKKDDALLHENEPAEEIPFP